MWTAWDLCSLASIFLQRGIGARFTAAELRTATGLDEERLFPLLAAMQHHDWIITLHVGTDPNPGLCWILTEHGHHVLTDGQPHWHGVAETPRRHRIAVV